MSSTGSSSPFPSYIDVGEPPSEKLADVLEHIERFLTDEGRQVMHREISEALMRSLQTRDANHVNRTIEAWFRTLLLKANGLDEKLAAVPDRPPGRSIDFDEVRRRLS